MAPEFFTRLHNPETVKKDRASLLMSTLVSCKYTITRDTPFSLDNFKTRQTDPYNDLMLVSLSLSPQCKI